MEINLTQFGLSGSNEAFITVTIQVLLVDALCWICLYRIVPLVSLHSTPLGDRKRHIIRRMQNSWLGLLHPLPTTITCLC